MRKSMMLQRSETEFSIGVPVTTRRAAEGSSILTERAFCVFWFLMFCASSSTTAERRNWRYSSMSRRMSA